MDRPAADSAEPPPAPRPRTARKPSPRALALILAAALALSVGGFALQLALAAPPVFRVEVGGRVLGFIPDAGWVEQARQAIAAAAEARLGRPVVLQGDVTLTRTRLPRDAVALDYDTLQVRLEAVLEPALRAVALVVNGQQVAVVEDEAAAEAVLQALRDAYLEAIGADAQTTILALEFEEEVEFRPIAAAPDAVRDVETARRILERGTDAVETHVVQKNESLWSIATARGLTVEALRQANPQLKGDLLQVGQPLSLIVPQPFVNIVSVEERVTLQSIPFPVKVLDDPNLWPWQQRIEQRGSYGQKEVVYRIARRNGRVTEQTVLSQRVLKEPVTQVQYRGTKVVPDHGTGSFIWPVAGPSRLTSGYGWRRWRVHEGLDIAAPRGTAILAADAGVVTKSEWYGDYGYVIFIDHGGGRVVTVYGHNEVNLVKVGDVVQKGQVIGRVGSTGRSTGPHLHFEVRVDGKPVDPLQFYPGG